MVALRRCGMPANAINLNANTLIHMQYKVKAAFGMSQLVKDASIPHSMLQMKHNAFKQLPCDM